MSNVKNTTPMKNQIQQHAMPLHDGPSQSSSSKPVVQIQILTASITRTSPVKDFENKRIEFENKRSISKKSKVKWSSKQKIDPKNHWNAQMTRLLSPKNPMMIIYELFNDVPIKIHEHSKNDCVTGYTATLEIDGHMCTADHISKNKAKQKACENFLRIMMAKKISELSEKNKESPMEIDIEEGEIGTEPKANEPPQDDFPWPLFASLAMHNLMHQWELQPYSREKQTNVIKSKPKVKAKPIKKFPEDPKKYNPVRLLNQMKPGVKFIETIISSKSPLVFQMKCEIDNIPFTGQGLKIKAAKKECCIAAIKYFWQYDFHAEADLPTKNLSYL